MQDQLNFCNGSVAKLASECWRRALVAGRRLWERKGYVQFVPTLWSTPDHAATTSIARNRDTQGCPQNKHAAHDGGKVAGNARRELEKKSGRRVITSENYLASTQAAKAKQVN